MMMMMMMMRWRRRMTRGDKRPEGLWMRMVDSREALPKKESGGSWAN
jgi:hypothetical protein